MTNSKVKLPHIDGIAVDPAAPGAKIGSVDFHAVRTGLHDGVCTGSSPLPGLDFLTVPPKGYIRIRGKFNLQGDASSERNLFAHYCNRLPSLGGEMKSTRRSHQVISHPASSKRKRFEYYFTVCLCIITERTVDQQVGVALGDEEVRERWQRPSLSGRSLT